MSYDQPQGLPGEPARYVFGPFAPDGGPGQPAPPAAGPPAPGPRRSRKVPILIGAGVLALVLVVVGVLAAVRSPSPDPPVVPTGPATATDPGPTGPASPAGPVPTTAKASDAVSGFLQAMATGNVTAAKAYAVTPVPDQSLMSPAVVAASRRLAPLRAISVPVVDDPDATRVPARYTLGSTPVSATYGVVKVAGAWKLRAIAAPVDVGAVRVGSVPMVVNGAKVSRSTVYLLPGAYAFTSGTRNYDYGKRSTLVVRDPADDANVYQLAPGISSGGRSAAVAAVKKSWSSCLRSKDPSPKSCPNRWTNSGFNFRKGTVRWTRKGSDPFKNPAVLVGGNLVRVRVKVNLGLRGTCTSNGSTGTCTGSLRGTVYAYATVSASSVTVRW